MRSTSPFHLAVLLVCGAFTGCGGGASNPGPTPGGKKDAGVAADGGADAGADGGGACGANVHCDGQCRDLSSDAKNCGACANTCATGELCAAGVCLPSCGNGAVDPGEACDDGALVQGDGCSSSCATEPGFVCSGAPTVCAPQCGDGLVVGTERCDDGNQMFADGCSPICAIEAGYACNGAPSTCTTICGNGVITGLEDCDDGNLSPKDGCSPSCLLEPGFICNDEPTVCQTLCGDGIIAGVESCDDKNGGDFDGCSSKCAIEAGYSCAGAPSVCVTGCGDGVTSGLETCDDGDAMGGDGCSAICVVERGYSCTSASPSVCAVVCGDGLIAGSEACDDFGAAPGDGCSALCVVEPGYSCSGEPSVCQSGCGDGVKAGGELCDDGNAVNGDGCSSSCFEENGYTCAGSPSVCAAVCGDGNVISGQEQCDDFNALNGDGCSTQCTVEPGFTCAMSSPSSCAPLCGDGTLKGAEGCDDQNVTAGDGCGATCAVEPGFTCTGEPSVCAALCGDGVRAGTEACDDGNVTGGDCCSAQCQAEPGCEVEPNDTDATANAFSSVSLMGQVKGYVKPSGSDKDVFGVSVPSNAQLIAQTMDGPLGSQCAAKGVDTRIVVREATGAQVFDTAGTFDDLSAGNWCSRFVSGALVAGAYFVEVARSPLAGPANDYTLQLSVKPPVCGNGAVEAGEACDDGNAASGDGCSAACAWELYAEAEPNGTAANANSVSLNKLASAAITPASDVDVFKLVLTQTADLRLETFDQAGPPSCAVDTNLQFLASDGTTVLGADDNGGVGACSRLDSELTAATRHLMAGTYFIRVDGKGAQVAGYSLLVKATALCGNGKIQGSEQCDGQANCTATCERVVVCGDGYLDGAETCDDGNTTSGDGCAAGCVMEALAEVEPNDTQAGAEARAAAGVLISGSTHVSGAITAGEVDTFKLSVAAQSVVRLETHGPKLGDCPVGLTTTLRLYDASFALLYSNDTSGVLACSAIVANLAPGTYYVRVEETGNNAAVAAYTLDAIFQTAAGSESEPNDAQPAADALMGSDVFIFGGHQTTSDEDWFALTVPAGKSIRAEVIEGSAAETCESLGIDSVLDLFDGNGVLLDGVDDVGRGACSLLDGTGALPAVPAAHNLNPGTYYLRVSSSRAASSGAGVFDYRLVVTLRQ